MYNGEVMALLSHISSPELFKRFKSNFILENLHEKCREILILDRICHIQPVLYDGVSKSFRTEHLKRELEMVQLSATRCSFIAIL
jgi:hypothetical protein